MSGPLIRDIPHIKKNLENAKNMKAFKDVMPLLGPMLRLFGVDTKGMQEALSEADNLERMAEDIASVPDRFNDLFAGRGWIIYDFMNLDVAKEAISKAETGDIDGAEAFLVEYYSPETIEWKLRTMYGVKAFRPRMSLAEKALIDYREERYHACVPVMLALLDGMVNEVHEKRRGFFAQEVDLQAWDSIAAHSKGLNVLTKIFQTGHYKTTTEPVTIPYRNGILHGMDLGYDNKMVAAKAWAALFAARDWAVRAEGGKLAEPPKEPEKGLLQVLSEAAEQQRKLNEDRARLDAWCPRSIRVGEDVLKSGEPKAFAEGTPERKLVEFLTYWKARNYGRMAQCFARMLKTSVNKDAAKVRTNYQSKKLQSFELLAIDDKAAAVTEITVRLWYEEDQATECDVTFRILNEDAEANPAARDKPDTE
jgi:hypothetical protein